MPLFSILDLHLLDTEPELDLVSSYDMTKAVQVKLLKTVVPQSIARFVIFVIEFAQLSCDLSMVFLEQ